MTLFKNIRRLLHPLLKPISRWYLSKPRTYRFKNVVTKVSPTVFHPGLFYSTKLILDFLSQRTLKNKKILELGAGAGLISIHCAKQGAVVTATDINPKALSDIRENAALNSVSVNVLHSDLFTSISPLDFDVIIINPPYYPKKIESDTDYAWYCGENFEYFRRLFLQLKEQLSTQQEIIMVLSEDCDIAKIKSIAEQNELKLPLLYSKQVLGEWNYIFCILKVSG